MFSYRSNDEEYITALLTAGRGWETSDCAVSLEPAEPPNLYSRQTGSFARPPVTDDGRYPGFFERLFSGRRNKPSKPQSSPESILPPQKQKTAKAPEFPIVELQVSLPQTAVVMPELTERLMLSLANRNATTALEIIGTESEILVQIALRETYAEQAVRQIKAHFPESTVKQTKDFLKNLFVSNGDRIPDNGCSLVIDFGLKREAVRPLNAPRSFEPDPLISLLSGLADLKGGEKCAYQVLFQAVKADWAEKFVAGLVDQGNNPRFLESKELLAQAKQKFSRPILAVAVRLGVTAVNRERALRIARGIAGTFQSVASPNGNELVALESKKNSPEDSLNALIGRFSFRSGMLLNVSESASLAHLPSASVAIEKLKRNEQKTKNAPAVALRNSLVLGENIHYGQTVTVTLSPAQATRHVLVLGHSGGGKSTFLANQALQVIRTGEGCCVLDPAGDLVSDIMSRIPENRIKDVIYFNASDTDYPLGFNPLEAFSVNEKSLLSSDLVALFRRYSSSWGSVMEAAAAYAVNAFLFNSRTGTLFDLKRFLVEKDFRREILQTVEDETVRYFWEYEASGINSKSLGSVLIRLDGFLRHPIIRNIVCQKSRLNFRQIIEEGKILLINVSQGLIGQENSALLGTLLLGKLYQVALSRQDIGFENRRPYQIFADEVQNYLTDSLGLALSSIRKYAVGVTAATQSFRLLRSLNAEIAESILTNSYTRICFRLGDEDAKHFAEGFSFFTAQDLQNLGIGEAIARVERADFDFNLRTFPLEPVPADIAEKRIKAIIEHTRKTYAAPKAKVESEIKISRQISNVISPIEYDKSSPQNAITDSFTESQHADSNVSDNQLKQNQGRGGRHHQEICAVIRRMAESYGFQVEIEKAVPVGAGSVDVSLENEPLKIACEVSVTSSTDYETKNVFKCLAAGYDYALVVVSNQKKLPALNAKLHSEIPLEQQEKVRAFSLSGLFAFLRELTSPKDAARHDKPAGQRLNFAEACDFFGVGASTLYRWIREGRVPFYRPGREYLFDRDELVLIGRHDLSGKRKASVKLQPLKIEKTEPKSKKEQNSRYRKMLKLD